MELRLSQTSRMEERNHILNINIGILGHVDSGKTSLVKALSTSLSTAALDKHPQSQQRGITLDLGFSAFTLPLSDRIQELLIEKYGSDHGYDTIQFTLVDCPGHASLIRTIIGGAQIIDMIVLVVDANKGIQTQTAECIVIGEITTDIMVIALNKVDLLPEHEREERIQKITKKIKKTLSTSKFADIEIIPVSASIGGEKVAANVNEKMGSGSNPNQGKASYKANTVSEGVDRLIEAIKDHVVVPHRNSDHSFYFAVDHCFPIKGHGTVMTGTVLSGSVHLNQIIEIPTLQVQKKVKSMQMFHKAVKSAQQGDRVGICVTNLDAKLIERGIASTPNSLPFISSAICLVKKIRFFRFPCRSQQRFHISIGHETIVANAIFFGGNEIANLGLIGDEKLNTDPTSKFQSSLTATYQKAFPSIDFDWNNDYLYQDDILPTEGLVYGKEPVQWVLLQFQQPVYCPIGSLIIGSRLDVDTKDHHPTTSVSGGTNPAQQCRLAFFGPIKEILPHHTSSVGGVSASSLHAKGNDSALERLKIFVWKQKECEVFRLTDLRGPMVHEAIGWKLVTGAGNSAHHYIGMKVLTERGIIGTIVSSYGTEGKFRIKFVHGAKIKVGDKLIFKFKKYLYDPRKMIRQTLIEGEEDREQQRALVEEQLKEIETEPAVARENEVKSCSEGIQSSSMASSTSKKQNLRVQRLLAKQKKKEEAEIQQKMIALALQEEGKATNLPLRIKDQSNLPTTETQQPSVPAVRESEAESVLSTEPPTALTFETLIVNFPNEEIRVGKIDSLKSEDAVEHAVVSGVFRMEENIRLFVGLLCLTETDDVGELIGPFGKLGKCKIKFQGKCRAGVSSAVKMKIKK